MVEVAEANNPNDNFNDRNLFRLIATKKFDKAIEFSSMKEFELNIDTNATILGSFSCTDVKLRLFDMHYDSVCSN